MNETDVITNALQYRQDDVVHGQVTNDQRHLYHNLINKCFNNRIYKSYDLLAYSEIEFCVNKNHKRDFDILDWSFVGILMILAAGNGISTVTNTGLRILKPFSIKNNWRRFLDVYKKAKPNAANKSNENGFYTDLKSKEDFTFLDTIRFPFTILNVIGHVYVMLAMLPSTNPEFYEFRRYSFDIKLGSGVPQSVQMYFAISSFLITLNDVKTLKKDKIFGLTDFYHNLKKRYLRLIPLYAFILFFESTLIRFFGNGPAWEVLAGRQWAYCRNSWWTNLLFINNYLHVEQQCNLPSKLTFKLGRLLL